MRRKLTQRKVRKILAKREFFEQGKPSRLIIQTRRILRQREKHKKDKR